MYHGSSFFIFYEVETLDLKDLHFLSHSVNTGDLDNFYETLQNLVIYSESEKQNKERTAVILDNL